MKLVVDKSPSESYALKNCVAINTKDLDAKVQHVLVKGEFAISIIRTDDMPKGKIGLSVLQRQWMQLSLGEDVEVTIFDPKSDGSNYIVSGITLEIDLFSRTRKVDEPIDSTELMTIFLKIHADKVFAVNEPIVFDFRGITLKANIKALEAIDSGFFESKGKKASIPVSRGLLTSQTIVTCTKAVGSTLEFSGQADISIISPVFKFEDLGIGGLSDEFSAIFRRAFASRIFPPSLIKSLGIKHVKGILLYGPPGTGKTLMARQIGKMLRAKEPKIVNGPEILNKFVGQSEENIRKLFQDAEDEYRKRGDSSDLHIIIFDELDAICKQRGSRNDGTGVGDSIVNQLLAKMDGVEQLNNILVIGMTNRKDMIDEALLRSGRMEVHIEISLPNEEGRLEILKIHTAKMRQNNRLQADVSLEKLAEATKNFSGAEIEGLVKSATSFALNRHIEGGTTAKINTNFESMVITKADFDRALLEVIPAFGIDNKEFEACMTNGIIDFGESVERILSSGQLFVRQTLQSQRSPLVTLLLHGTHGAGTTSLAVKLATSGDFPYVKLISPDNFVGYSENAKCNEISKIFEKSYRSPLSVIVIDSIERLLDYVNIGPRFSNQVLQTLLVLLKKSPPRGHRLLVISTTSQKQLLEEMGMDDCFSGKLHVPTIKTIDEVMVVIQHMKIFGEKDLTECKRLLTSMPGKVSIGIKKLLMVIETARQDEGSELEKFIQLIGDSFD